MQYITFFSNYIFCVLQENADPHCAYPQLLPVTPVKPVDGASPVKRERKSPPDPIHPPTPMIHQNTSPHPVHLPAPLTPVKVYTTLVQVEPVQPVETVYKMEVVEPVDQVDPVEPLDPVDPVERIEPVELVQDAQLDALDLSLRKMQALSCNDVKVSAHQLKNILQYNIYIYSLYIYILECNVFKKNRYIIKLNIYFSNKIFFFVLFYFI